MARLRLSSRHHGHHGGGHPCPPRWGLLARLRLAQWLLWANGPPEFRRDGKESRKGFVNSGGGVVRVACLAGTIDGIMGHHLTTHGADHSQDHTGTHGDEGCCGPVAAYDQRNQHG